MTAPAVIHIGWARAASTAFRRNFLQQHPEILAVDRGQNLAAGPAGVILQHLKGARNAEFRRFAPELRSAWELYQNGNGGRVLCLTDEELSIGLPSTGVMPATIAARCAMLFPRARTLAIVRDQVSAIRSFYALSQRAGRADGLPFSKWTRHFILRPAKGQSFSYLFAYMTTLRAYLRWQPREDVLVQDYDRLRSDHAGVYADVARRLGISESACEHLPNEIVNESPRALLEDIEHGELESGLDAEIRSLYERDNSALAREFGVVFSSANHARAL